MIKKKNSILSSISEYAVLIGIVVVFIIGMSIASPYFLTFTNITNIIQYVSTYGIVSIGMLLVILTGGINLSVGGTLAISAYIGCSLMLRGFPWYVSVLVCILTGILCAIAGIIVTGRMNSVAVSIAKGLDTRCITCCVLGGASVTRGGKGTIIGCFLGVFIIGLLQNSLDLLAVSSYWQEFIQGIVLFLAVSADFFRTLIARRKKK